jgi:AcrR family transcriptional regulator
MHEQSAQIIDQRTANLWLSAAYDALIGGGVEAVKVMSLAKRTGLTRTGFYWHFKDLSALLEALLTRWDQTNTGNLEARAAKPARTITEAMLNVFDCWHDAGLFDASLDLAVRNWARLDPAVQVLLDRADVRRTRALIEMFERFFYGPEDAEVRAKTVIYTQIGYFSMRTIDPPLERLARVPGYARVFTGVEPTAAELAAFRTRHGQ